MIVIDDKTECCGCAACANICPKKCITMKADEEGFLYPSIDRNKCINCGQCEKTCAFRLDKKHRENASAQDSFSYVTDGKGKIFPPQAFAIKHKNLSVRMLSRSGGIFTALSDEIIKKQGSVYGCVLRDDLKGANHIRAVNKKQRNAMCGSKYIQSEIGFTFINVEEDLKNLKPVLFSGTSCQIAGLKSFLQADYPGQLFCVDIVCHGVPSPLLWEEYLNWSERKYGSSVERVNFRNKEDFGWREHVETLFFKNGKKVNSKIFTSLFYGHCFLRPSCYHCPYKDITHPGDITIADYWGIEKLNSSFDDNKGVSLVLVNTNHGLHLLERVRNDVYMIKTDIKNSLQPPLRYPFSCPSNRQTVWKDFHKYHFDFVVKKYARGHLPIICRIKNILKSFLKI